MKHELTQQQIDTLEDVAYDCDATIRSYSGRAMFGDACLAVVLDVADLFQFAVALMKADPELAELLGDVACRVDSMGRGEVAYWSSVGVAGTSLAEDDEDED